MNEDRQKALELKINRADKGMKITLVGAVVTGVFLLCFIVVQQFQTQQAIKDSLASSKVTAAANHKKTQEYVRCVAIALTEPMAGRNDALNMCGLDVGEQGMASPAVPTVPATPANGQPQTSTTPNQQTTSGGPDPSTQSTVNNNTTITQPTPTATPAPTTPGLLSGIPVIGPLIEGIKQIL